MLDVEIASLQMSSSETFGFIFMVLVLGLECNPAIITQ